MQIAERTVFHHDLSDEDGPTTNGPQNSKSRTGRMGSFYEALKLAFKFAFS